MRSRGAGLQGQSSGHHGSGATHSTKRASALASAPPSAPPAVGTSSPATPSSRLAGARARLPVTSATAKGHRTRVRRGAFQKKAKCQAP
eukprot:CAMPEP_0197418332 /NCGR_PEP_ID=MMETSP1170-20131217/4091_1 /TAXON_ID=54406 /ORGANISM="Sarcinochrysis sp, Strain CCMP770" /LENGTH=88 /DNA_ID=CAMNT_0042945363 /DNA_START=18 /DNA_END=281 /DNA_ORIENTATION=+